MGDRLSDVLEHVIYCTKDKYLKKVLQKVVDINDEIACYDWNDWNELIASDAYGNEIIKQFENIK